MEEGRDEKITGRLSIPTSQKTEKQFGRAPNRVKSNLPIGVIE
jgi:hypothetical protein